MKVFLYSETLLKSQQTQIHISISRCNTALTVPSIAQWLLPLFQILAQMTLQKTFPNHRMKHEHSLESIPLTHTRLFAFFYQGLCILYCNTSKYHKHKMLMIFLLCGQNTSNLLRKKQCIY